MVFTNTKNIKATRIRKRDTVYQFNHKCLAFIELRFSINTHVRGKTVYSYFHKFLFT